MEKESRRPAFWEAVPEEIALLCASVMLVALPLVFHDAFFDINRFKVRVVIAAAMPLAMLFLLARVIRGGRPLKCGLADAPALMMALLLLACTISCAGAGFAPSTLDGSDGRYCGLWFLLSCGAAFYVIGFGLRRARLLTSLMMASATLCAALGVVNAMGMDPLGFYTHIRAGQEQIFLSTIGNFDFFGTYLVMLLPLCASRFIFDEKPVPCAAGAICSLVVALGAAVSRTDCAALGVHLVFFVLLLVSGESLAQMARTLLLWAVCTLALPAVRLLIAGSPFHPAFTGLALFLSRSPLTLILACLLALAGAIAALLEKRGARAPGRRRLMTAGLALASLAALLLLAAILFFTLVEPERDLGMLADILRFDDSWGSRRGFVYTRALRAYADYSPKEKLIGRGLEQTLATLKPYFDNPAMLSDGVYNDAHCQPLQFLLNCGLLGAAAFVTFYLVTIVTVFRHMGHDPLLMGLFASLAAYLLIMLLNVTQPILIATYMSLCALALARIRTLTILRNVRGEETP